MDKSFDRMWARLPDVLKSDDIKKLFIGLGSIFDLLEKEQEPYIYTEVLSKLSGEMLDKYGFSYGVPRRNLSDKSYINKILIERAKSEFIPTLDNFINIIKKVTGYRVDVTEGWNLPIEQKAMLKLLVTIPVHSDRDLIFDLDRLYSCGVKTEYELKQEKNVVFEVIGEHNITGIRNLNKLYETIEE